jgi:hypothetical protein
MIIAAIVGFIGGVMAVVVLLIGLFLINEWRHREKTKPASRNADLKGERR